MVSEQNVKILNNTKKRSLLIYSEAAKAYESFFKFIYDNEKFSESLIESELSDADVLLIEHMLPNIIHMCEDEWRGDEVPFEILEGGNTKPCQLCGYPDTKRIYYIYNTVNGKALNVGSTCIGDFISIDKLHMGKSKSEIERKGRENLNLRKLNERFPGIQRIVEEWSSYVNTFEVMIPKRISQPYLELGIELEQKYTGFLKNKDKSLSFDDFEPLLMYRDDLCLQMVTYNNDHRGKHFVVTQKIVSWLNQRGKESVIAELSERGYITVDTVGKVWEEGYTKSILEAFNQKLSVANARITTTDFSEEIFEIDVIQPIQISLRCKMERFVSRFGWTMFESTSTQGATITPYNLFITSSIASDSSKIAILSALNQLLRKRGYSLIFESNTDRYLEFNEIDFVDQKTKEIVVLKMDWFVHTYKMYIFEKKNILDIISDINKLPDKRYTQRELREIRNVSM